MIREFFRTTLAGLFMARLLTPRSAARACLYAIRRHVLRQSIPGTAIVALTFECQCRCACCSSDIFRKHYADKPGMSREELFVWIGKIADSGSPRIHFTGGESLLHGGLADAVEACSRKGLVSFVETNGIAVDEDAVLRLKRAGVGSVNVSLDSAEPAQHDALRGAPGCHARAIAALRLCVSNGVRCMVSTYATRENVSDGGLAGVIGLARRLGCSGIRILAPQPAGGWLKREDVILSREELGRIEKMLPLAFPVLNRTALIQCPLRTGYKIFVLPDGQLAPCEHLPFIFKDSKNMSLERLRERIHSCAMFAKPHPCMPRDPGFRREHLDGLTGDSPVFI
ncbi:MAG TPA: hypothetical protein DEB40_14480 [Elusimicrobia bacterium]|nr:hypothetical protein [Elusimicrobiota bacterium]HBT62940.1 hypothetical protein [Elusimicrobiota bacterium]